MVKTSQLIKSMDYAYIRNDKQVKEVGLSRGDVVLVTGVKVAPIKKDDPYLQRVFVHVVKVNEDDGYHFIPSEGNDHKIVLMDPRSLDKLGEEGQEFYKECLTKQYESSD